MATKTERVIRPLKWRRGKSEWWKSHFAETVLGEFVVDQCLDGEGEPNGWQWRYDPDERNPEGGMCKSAAEGKRICEERYRQIAENVIDQLLA